MKFCKNCGKQLEDNVKFCSGCGATNDVTNEQPAQTQQTANQTDFSAKVANLNNTADTTNQFDKDDIEKNKVMGVLAYILFFIPLLAASDSPFARFHANQGLVLFLTGVLSSVILVVPILGWIIGPILSLVVFVFAIIGIVNALNGTAKELPIIGKFKILK